MEDFLTAIQNIQKTVSEEVLKGFDDWMGEFGSS
jgi:hypothetical protein